MEISVTDITDATLSLGPGSEHRHHRHELGETKETRQHATSRSIQSAGLSLGPRHQP